MPLKSMTTDSRIRACRFVARGPFHFGLPTFAAEAVQHADGQGAFLTTATLFIQQVLARHPDYFRILSTQTPFPVLPTTQWRDFPFGSKRCLILTPGDALGDCVGAFLFLQAVRRHCPQARLAVACTGSATDLFRLDKGLEVLPLWAPESSLAQYDAVIDLSQVEGWSNVATCYMDLEAALLAAFNLPPTPAFPQHARALKAQDGLRLGIFPLATSPLRSVPPVIAIRLAEALTQQGSVTVFLNRYQRQGRLYETALRDKLPQGVALHPGFQVVGDLIKAVEALDYGIFADSGPGHLTKLFGLPGLAIHTTTDAAEVAGRFQNLTRWQAPYQGEFCQAPCGLAKARAAADGRAGCMGSLNLPAGSLSPLQGQNLDAAEELLLTQPAPCGAAVIERADEIVQIALAALQGARG